MVLTKVYPIHFGFCLSIQIGFKMLTVFRIYQVLTGFVEGNI